MPYIPIAIARGYKAGFGKLLRLVIPEPVPNNFLVKTTCNTTYLSLLSSLKNIFLTQS